MDQYPGGQPQQFQAPQQQPIIPISSPSRGKRAVIGIVIAVFAVGIIGGGYYGASAMTVEDSLWNSGATPQTKSSPATHGVELGMKFQAAVSGQITGLRFYKGSGNGGTHTGSLWDKNGNKLASVTFTNESNEGWQTANFKEPVEIAGGVTYVISYFAPQGHNAVDTNYFNKPYTHGRLTGLNNGWDGGNGVFSFSDGSTFPLSSNEASNYWVDPIFKSKKIRAKVTPSQPVSLQATAVKDKSVTIAWLPSVSATPIKQYDVYRDGKFIKSIDSTAPAQTTSFHQPKATVAYESQADQQIVTNEPDADLTATTTVNNNAKNTATNTNESSKTTQTKTTNEYYTFTDDTAKPSSTYTYEVKAKDTNKKESKATKTTVTTPKDDKTAAPAPAQSSTAQNGGTSISVNNSAKNTATGTNQSSSTSQTTNDSKTTEKNTTTGSSQSSGSSGSTTSNSQQNTSSDDGQNASSDNTGTVPTADSIRSQIEAARKKALESTNNSSSGSVWNDYEDDVDWNDFWDNEDDWDINSGSSSSSSTNTTTNSGSYNYNSNLSNSAH